MTRTEYIKEQSIELIKEGWLPVELPSMLSDEYYNIVIAQAKAGQCITKDVYNDLTSSQRWHFDKHYNCYGDKVILKS